MRARIRYIALGIFTGLIAAGCLVLGIIFSIPKTTILLNIGALFLLMLIIAEKNINFVFSFLITFLIASFLLFFILDAKLPKTPEPKPEPPFPPPSEIIKTEIILPSF
ncbi:hypothetical protein DRQ11_11370 [candidate division KSB1 bacterium]|nr:MAG: hypothetical protein DRQ11_11370 [candidate division KSB1 bacterium]